VDREELFHKTSRACVSKSGQEVNVEDIAYRESRDSENNPTSTPVMVGLDVTGSMGFIPEFMTKEGLGPFVEEILQRRPITDPHILFMGIGDATQSDKAPLQATQFEADDCICDQLTDIWIEKGGGGNRFESYDLAWAFAAYKTKTDAWDKRQAKGYLFTIGDEEFPQMSSATYMKQAFGSDCPQSPTPQTLLEAAQQRYRVFHVVIEEGHYCSHSPDRAINSWKQVLGNRCLLLNDHRCLSQLLVSAIALDQNTDLEEVLGWWGEHESEVIRRAVGADSQ
jgi:hypothetical protein